MKLVLGIVMWEVKRYLATAKVSVLVDGQESRYWLSSGLLDVQIDIF